MIRLIAPVTAVLISTAAFAGNSDRYNDMRLDTSLRSTTPEKIPQRKVNGASTRHTVQRSNTRDRTEVTVADRNKTRGEGFIYGGFGPGNDSR